MKSYCLKCNKYTKNIKPQVPSTSNGTTIMDVAGVLQEAGNPDSRARTRSQVEYNIIPYTSTSITLPHLCQGYHGHYIVISSNWGNGKVSKVRFLITNL